MVASPAVLIASGSPCGVQPRTRVRAAAPQWVSRRAGPPSTKAVYTSAEPSRVAVQAIREPSGENLGWETGDRSAVSRQARPPSSGASQTSSSATKVTRSPCRWGWRR